MHTPQLSLLCAKAALISVGIFVFAPCRAAVVAEWDFRANEKITVVSGTASKDATLINGGKVNTGPAVSAGDRRIAEGYLESPRTPFNGSPWSNHGVQSTATWDQLFGTTSLGEGTLVMVARFRGNNFTHRKTLFSHESGDPYAEMYLGYSNYSTSSPPTLVWSVARQYAAGTRNAVVPVTMEVGSWYLMVATWKAGTPSKLFVRKIGSAETLEATAQDPISSTTNNGCNGKLAVGVIVNPTNAVEGSDMDIAFVQMHNVRNNDIAGFYNQLVTAPENAEEADIDSMGPAVTFRQEFSGNFDAKVGTMSVVTEPYASVGSDDVALAPGLFHPGETRIDSGVRIGANPRQRLFCGTRQAIAPSFNNTDPTKDRDKGGTLSFYWSPDFSATDNNTIPLAHLWSTNTSGDSGTFSGMWYSGTLIANFGEVESKVAMPVEKHHWYLITVSWGPFVEAGMRGRVHWQEVKPESEVQYSGGGTVVFGSAGNKLVWGDSELCIGATVDPVTDSGITGARGLIDRVVYQDGLVVRAEGADAIYENTFFKYAANPLTNTKFSIGGTNVHKNAQEVQFPSPDLTVRGYPYAAMRSDAPLLVNLGTTSPVPGFRQVPDPRKWDYAMKTAPNGTNTGIALDSAKVLPNALKTRGVIRLLYKPASTQPLTAPATLVASGSGSSQKGFCVSRQDQNKVVFTMNTQGSPLTFTATMSPANQFTSPKDWYYIGVSWSADVNSRMRVYVRKLDGGENPPARDHQWNSNVLVSGTSSLPGNIHLGTREGTNTENAEGTIDEVLFVDDHAWGQNEFDGDYDTLRHANDFYEFRRQSPEKRVCYIPAEKFMRLGIQYASELMSPAGAHMQIGYQIPLELKTVLNYEPGIERAKRYYREDIIGKINSRGLVPTPGGSTTADTSVVWRAYQMLQWFGNEKTVQNGQDVYEFRDKAIQMLQGAMTEFTVYKPGDHAWAYGSVYMDTGGPVADDGYALSPQSRSYDRFASGLIGAGEYLKANTSDETLGDSMVALGEKVVKTYAGAVYNPAVPIPPYRLEVTGTKSDTNIADTDCLYITNNAYPVWKETKNEELGNLLKITSHGWSNYGGWGVDANGIEWGHSRRRVMVDSNAAQTSDVLYGDGKWNQIRGMTVGYPVDAPASRDPELIRKTQKSIDFLRSSGRWGMYPAKVQAGTSNRNDFHTADPADLEWWAWGDAQSDWNNDDGDNNNVSRAGAVLLRDMLFAYDATQSIPILLSTVDLADALVKAGRYYHSARESMNCLPRLSSLQGVCRVQVTGDLGEMLKVVKTLSAKTVVEKPVADFDEAVVYLAPGKYDFTAKRGGSGNAVAVTVTGTAMTVAVDAP